MNLRIFYVGKASSWVDEGIAKYARRMPKLELVQVKDYPPRTLFERMLKQAGPSSFLVLLDSLGVQRTSEELAANLAEWNRTHKQIVFLIGNDIGFASNNQKRVDDVWSLSPLTFPYMVARLIVVEQLFRAMSILEGHPYHRS